MILGVAQRSGTNFLARLLRCHEDCVSPGRPLYEDHLLRQATMLRSYARDTARHWRPEWGDPVGAQGALVDHLGAGLASFLQDRAPGKRVVTKTPSAENLDAGAELLAHVWLVILVRDGRAVVESLHTGFGQTYEQAMRTWRAGARAILGFQRRATMAGAAGPWVLVQYEDLVADLEGQLDRLLALLQLDPAGFDLDAARNLPVFGSSFAAGDGEVAWGPHPKEEGFDPLTRFSSWPRARHERFNRLAGAEQRALGYPTARFDAARSASAGWAAYGALADAAWPVVRVGGRLARRGRQMDRRIS